MDDRKVNMKNSKQSLLECNICNRKSFKTSNHLKKHIKTIHEGRKDFKCDSCGKSFTAAGSLKIHINTIHEGHKDFKCDSCGKSFTIASYLDKHINKVH